MASSRPTLRGQPFGCGRTEALPSPPPSYVIPKAVRFVCDLVELRRNSTRAPSRYGDVVPWRFADRGWFVNDGINLRSDANRAAVAEALVSPNVAFGLHRWFKGGCAPDAIAIATPQEWEAELARGRPGDNLMLLSLRDVANQALLRLGEVTGRPLRGLGDSDLTVIRDFLRDDRREVAVVHRYSPRPGEVTCAHSVLWDPQHDEWAAQIDQWKATSGELWFFDEEILWQRHDTRIQADTPPEDWMAQHGLYLVDGYLPDAEG